MLRSKRSSLDDPSHIRKYKHKGTLEGAKDIVKARGLLGLYSGFHLHFSMVPWCPPCRLSALVLT